VFQEESAAQEDMTMQLQLAQACCLMDMRWYMCLMWIHTMCPTCLLPVTALRHELYSFPPQRKHCMVQEKKQKSADKLAAFMKFRSQIIV
jgi:hypothetical protein